MQAHACRTHPTKQGNGPTYDRLTHELQSLGRAPGANRSPLAHRPTHGHIAPDQFCHRALNRSIFALDFVQQSLTLTRGTGLEPCSTSFHEGQSALEIVYPCAQFICACGGVGLSGVRSQGDKNT